MFNATDSSLLSTTILNIGNLQLAALAQSVTENYFAVLRAILLMHEILNFCPVFSEEAIIIPLKIHHAHGVGVS